MALKARKAAIAAIAQAQVGTFLDPIANIMPCSNLSLEIASVTAPSNEYTGTIDQQGDDVIGRTVTVTFDLNLRAPGGADVPAAGAYLPGIFLVACKMTELRTTTAIPAAPEALTAGSTTGFTGGVGMAATANLYKGMLVDLIGQGALPLRLSAIRANTAGRAVTLCETLATNASGNYQIPKQLAFMASVSDADPLPLSLAVFLDGVRYRLVDMVPNSAVISIPTSTREGGTPPTIRISLRGRINAKDDIANPVVPSLGTTPLFRNGKQFLALTRVAGAGITYNRGLTVAAPPNPNQPDGSDADELTGIQSTVDIELHSYRKAIFDPLALADAQAQHPMFALYGSGSGQTVAIVVPDARLTHSAPQLGDQFITETVPLQIDVFDRNVSIVFPYW